MAAIRQEPSDHGAETVQLLAFQLEGERYALELSAVEQVVRAVIVTPLPAAAPRSIRGVINLHGKVVPVGDLRRRLGLPEAPLRLEDQIIVARTPRRLLGVLTEGATEVVGCRRDSIARRDECVAGAEAIAGIARTEDGLILIHDLSQFLSTDEERRLDEAIG